MTFNIMENNISSCSCLKMAQSTEWKYIQAGNRTGVIGLMHHRSNNWTPKNSTQPASSHWQMLSRLQLQHKYFFVSHRLWGKHETLFENKIPHSQWLSKNYPVLSFAVVIALPKYNNEKSQVGPCSKSFRL